VRGCFFSEQGITGHDHFLVDAGEQFRREQREVVFQRLQGKALVVPVGNAEHQPQGAVLVGQFVEAVEIGVQA
jgi:hypothetical protein